MRKGKQKYIKAALRKLEPLSKISNRKSFQLIPLLSDDSIHAICESCFNLLQNTYGLDKRKLGQVKRKLYESRNDIRSIVNPNTTLLKKRKLLMKEQTGRGVFTVLATTIIPALIAALAK